MTTKLEERRMYIRAKSEPGRESKNFILPAPITIVARQDPAIAVTILKYFAAFTLGVIVTWLLK
jgi:hypothetical protein